MYIRNTIHLNHIAITRLSLHGYIHAYVTCARARMCVCVYIHVHLGEHLGTRHTRTTVFFLGTTHPPPSSTISFRGKERKRREDPSRMYTFPHSLLLLKTFQILFTLDGRTLVAPPSPRYLARNTLLQRSRERDEMIGYDDDDDARLAPISHGGKSDRSSRNIGSSRSDDDRSPVPFPPIQSGSGAVYEEENHSVWNVPLRN